MKIFYLISCLMILSGCQVARPVAVYPTLSPVVSGCVCPDGSRVAGNYVCPAQLIPPSLHSLELQFSGRARDSIIDEFYQAERERVRLGIINQLTCGELSQRNYLLLDVANVNPSRAYVAITGIETLYQRYIPALVGAHNMYWRKHRPQVLIVEPVHHYYRHRPLFYPNFYIRYHHYRGRR